MFRHVQTLAWLGTAEVMTTGEAEELLASTVTSSSSLTEGRTSTLPSGMTMERADEGRRAEAARSTLGSITTVPGVDTTVLRTGKEDLLLGVVELKGKH